jgi:hypothetical protein
MENVKMSGPKQLSAAEQAREAYRQKRLERSRTRQAGYAAPELIDVLQPIEGDDRTLWPKANWSNDIHVVIPPLVPAPEVDDVVTLVVAGVDVEVRPITDPDDPEQFKFTVPAATIVAEGRYEFAYRFLNSDGNQFRSDSVFLSVDHTPPNDNDPGTAPSLPQDVINNGGLRLDYLDAHTTLDVTIPRSSDIIAGDIIDVYWGRPGAAIPTRPTASRPVTEADAASPGSPLVVGIPSADIQNLPDGDIAILYRYVDRTGNLGQPSAWVELYVDLAPLPENLVEPVVPLHMAPDLLIDRADAQLGVTVLIPSPGYDNQKPGEDCIQVSWEGVPLPAVPLAAFPMEILVPWTVLAAGGHDTARPIKVKYSVMRGDWRTDSAEIDINVDFTVAGIDPGTDNPGPVNEALPVVVIKSREAEPVDDVLGEADKNLPAVAEIPSNPVAKGQTLRLYWGALESPVDEVIIDAQKPSDPISFTIPWDKIVEGGYNDNLPVYYSTWNGVNEQESTRTPVDVRIIDIIGLNEVEFPDRWQREPPTEVPVINCCSEPWNGVRIKVLPDPANFSVDDTLDISWQAYEDRESTVPLAGTEYSFPPVTLNQEMIDKGFEKTVPYATHIEPIVTSGSGIVTCVLTKSSGQSGSSKTQVRVSRVGNGGLICTPEAPGEC